MIADSEKKKIHEKLLLEKHSKGIESWLDGKQASTHEYVRTPGDISRKKQTFLINFIVSNFL